MGHICQLSLIFIHLWIRKVDLTVFYCNFTNKWKGYAQPVPYSDHYLVGLLVPKPSDVGLRLWRFPGDLLDDENFCMDPMAVVGRDKSPLFIWISFLGNSLQIFGFF